MAAHGAPNGVVPNGHTDPHVTATLDSSDGHGVSNGPANLQAEVESLDPATVLIAGSGPVGLLVSIVLSFYGVQSILLERNLTTTRWPKMDLTNARSMEMFRKLGLADELRAKGVPPHIPSTVLISSGLNNPSAITSWLHPSVDEYRRRIASRNDGTMPLEPYQRISQAVFEKWMKEKVDEDKNIDARFGWKVDSVSEEEITGRTGVRVVATNVKTGKKKTFITSWLVGCDGASSIVRRSLGIGLEGGPVPGYALLVHFKSRDLSRLQRQGQFWHIFFVGEGGLRSAIIAQDEIDTWTIHLQLPLGTDHSQIDSHDAIYTALGGLGERYEIKVDEILVRSTFRPSIAISSMYRSTKGRIFLAGDAAHQNIPTGGYGMNMGLMDAWDIGWKLAAVINGNGGDGLLNSYEADRRPVALMSIERSGVHMATHMTVGEILKPDASIVDADTNEGKKTRERIHNHYQTHDGENKDLGVEMGYRYKSSICMEEDQPAEAPEWVPSRYNPSTLPGGRAPHVFLNDGSPIFDHFGKGYTLIEFVESEDDRSADLLVAAAKSRSVLLDHVRLIAEDQARQLWERRLVIVRPDGHVSWRSDSITDAAAAMHIIGVIAGLGARERELVDAKQAPEEVTFSMVIKESQVREYKLEMMGQFQQ